MNPRGGTDFHTIYVEAAEMELRSPCKTKATNTWLIWRRRFPPVWHIPFQTLRLCLTEQPGGELPARTLLPTPAQNSYSLGNTGRSISCTRRSSKLIFINHRLLLLRRVFGKRGVGVGPKLTPKWDYKLAKIKTIWVGGNHVTSFQV